jgi:hypothetical protein
MNQIPKDLDFSVELMKSIDLLSQSGKQIFLIEDVPDYAFSPENCKYQALCSMSSKTFHRQEHSLNLLLEDVRVRFPSIQIVSLEKLFCNTNSCSMLENGLLMYRDQNHLNINGSRYVGNAIVKQHQELLFY